MRQAGFYALVMVGTFLGGLALWQDSLGAVLAVAAFAMFGCGILGLSGVEDAG